MGAIYRKSQLQGVPITGAPNYGESHLQKSHIQEVPFTGRPIYRKSHLQDVPFTRSPSDKKSSGEKHRGQATGSIRRVEETIPYMHDDEICHNFALPSAEYDKHIAYRGEHNGTDAGALRRGYFEIVNADL